LLGGFCIREGLTMADNVASVQQLYADFAKGDIEAVLAAFDERIEWFEAEGNPYWEDAPNIVGPQQVVEHVFARIPQDYDGFTIHLNRVVGLGDTVLAEVRYTATGTATGLPLDAQVAHVWDFKDGKVVRWQQYADTAQIRAVLGVSS
jgi:ketosteroid isomerase-like protein